MTLRSVWENLQLVVDERSGAGNRDPRVGRIRLLSEICALVAGAGAMPAGKKLSYSKFCVHLCQSRLIEIWPNFESLTDHQVDAQIELVNRHAAQ